MWGKAAGDIWEHCVCVCVGGNANQGTEQLHPVQELGNKRISKQVRGCPQQTGSLQGSVSTEDVDFAKRRDLRA